MKYNFKAVWGCWGCNGKGILVKPIAWIGPSENLIPEPRRNLKPIDKQYIFHRQGSRCNFCHDVIQLYPYPNCDADHVIPISLGGKTNVENMQLLCVTCHRFKSASESMKQADKVLDVNIVAGRDVYIMDTRFTYEFPMNVTTPMEAICENNHGMSLLRYEKVKRIKESVFLDYLEMLERFSFVSR